MNFLIADDHPFTLAGTRNFIEESGHKVIAVCPEGKSALEKIKTLLPDVAVLDINMPGLDGLELLELIRLSKLPVKVIFLTSHNEMSIYKKASEYGVDGYLLKNFAQEELSDCISTLLRGEEYLSPRISSNLIKDNQYHKDEILAKLNFVETKVFELVSRQKSTKEIAELLFLSEKTVEAYRTSIIDKLDLPKERNSLLKFASKFSPFS